jgi:hypothetical protein
MIMQDGLEYKTDIFFYYNIQSTANISFNYDSLKFGSKFHTI